MSDATEEADATEQPVSWGKITGAADVPEGSLNYQSHWMTYGDNALRSYEGDLYIEEGDGEWMELKSWIQAVAAGEIE